MVDDLWIPLVPQQWYQSQRFNEEFDRLLISKVFLTKVVRRSVPLSVATTIQVYGYPYPLEGEHKELNNSQFTLEGEHKELISHCSEKWRLIILLVREPINLMP
jgi:hypothetical protein